MASTVVRRPLPALIALVALLLLTGIVWWRVLHRGTDSAHADPCRTTSTSAPAPASSTALPAPGQITVQVLNSTSRGGIAAAARRTLLADGFLVPSLAGNDTPTQRKTNTGVAQLRYGPTGEQAATHLRYYFPGAVLVPTASKSSTVVIALGPKYERIATPVAAKAALRSASLVVASPSPTPTATASSTSC